MKNITKKLKTGFLMLSAIALFGALTLPLVPAETAYASACDSRILTGTVETGTPPTHARFEYSTNSSTVSNGGGTPTPVQVFNNEGTFPMQQLISGLNASTTYYYRIAVTNNYGTSNGDVRSFTTDPCASAALPTVSLTADSRSVTYGGTSTVRWTSQNATSCTASGGTNGWSGSKNLSSSFPTGALYSTTTYNITCSNSSGSASDSVTISVTNQVQTCQDPSAINYGGELPCRYNQTLLPTVSLTADDTNIDSGDSTTLRWTSQNATSCTASGGTNGWSGSKNLSGSFNTGSLTSTRVYSITCSNSSGSAVDSVTINVDDDNSNEPTVDINADDTDISSGDSTIVRWDSDDADTCRGTNGTNGWSGSKNLSGSFRTGALYSTTTFKITCTNDDGSDDDSVTIRVNENNQVCRDTGAINYLGNLPCRYNVVNNQPTVFITADSTNIAFNTATNIRWSTTNATSCTASGGSVGWAGPKSIGPGSFYTGSLTGTRTYIITCSNNVGSATDSVTVNVRGQVLGVTTVRQPSSLVLVTSTVDRNQPIVPTLDNTNPCPGDEINYSITYQNIGTALITGLVLRIDLPLEVDYLSSTPYNPMVSGQTLIFNLGTLGANKSGTVSVRVRVRNDVPAGAALNFPATLSYVDPSGFPQSVSANVSANVCGTVAAVTLGANVFGAGFLPNSIFGWLLLLILILILILLARYLFSQSFQRRTVTTLEQPALGKRTTTTTL